MVSHHQNDLVKRYPRGYTFENLNSIVLRQIRSMEKPNLLCSVVDSVLTWLSVSLMIYGYLLLLPKEDSFNDLTVIQCMKLLFGYGVIILLIARQQRVFEIMVHDASHWRWHQHRKINDWLANLLVAYPMFMSVEAYRKVHMIHHQYYGSKSDPCRQRFEKISSSKKQLLWQWLAQNLLWYLKNYYSNIQNLTHDVWVKVGLWHMFFIIMSMFLVFLGIVDSVWQALFKSFSIWFFFWVLPAVSALMGLRLIAEYEEHDYHKGATEFETTYTHLGFWHCFFHPYGDRYHLAHHLFPNVPSRSCRKVHQLLVANDDRYQQSLSQSKVF